MPKETLTAVMRRLAQEFGGADNPQDFIPEQGQLYCDKGSHREMSLFHAPQHEEHWKKETKKKWNPLWRTGDET